MAPLVAILSLITCVAQGVFIVLFLEHNAPGLTNFWLLAILGAVYFLVFCYVAFNQRLTQFSDGLLGSGWFARFISILLGCGLVFLALDNLIFDYFQAITTSEPVIYAMLASWIAILINLLLALIRSFGNVNQALARSINLSTIALLGLPVMLLVSLITSPSTNPKLDLVRDVFIGGQDGYDVYRIPAMLVIPQGAVLANGETTIADRIIAMAEARRDGALDTGVIDIVQKHSDDGGRTWSEQEIICSYRRNNIQGKCGNPTPVYDLHSGKIFLAYNLSGIPANRPETQRHHSSHIMQSEDGGASWGNSVKIVLPNAVFGPGHGIQKRHMPFIGRLVIPYNTSVGGKGSSVALYSDDYGQSWHSGLKLGSGNENELAESANGDLIMATRHIASVGKPPKPNGRLFAVSADGGHSWSATSLDTNLPTPICQASIIAAKDGRGMFFLNPANTKARVQLTLRYSANSAQSWTKSMLITQGPAAYSQLGQLSDSKLIMLYENGALSYSQKISFASLALDNW